MIKKFVIAALLAASIARADETIPFNTKTGKAKVTSSGVGTASKPYNFTEVNVTGIAGGGGGTPGGLTGQIQYKFNSAAFGGVPYLSYDSVAQQLTLHAGIRLFLVDPSDITKKVQLTLSGISTGTTRNFTIPNADFVGPVPITAASNQFLTGLDATTGIFTRTTVSDAALSTTDITTNNASTTKHGFLKKLSGNATEYQDGTGNWSVPPGSGGAPGGSNQQIQFNNSSAFGGIPSFTYNSGSTLVTLQGGAKFNLVDPTDTTKKATLTLSGIATGTTRNTTVPNADNVWVIPGSAVSNQWVTTIDTGGNQLRTQPNFSNLAGSIATSQQNIPVGKTLFVDASNGNNTTALPNRLDKPYATLHGGSGALAFASAGDEIIVGPGSFSSGSTPLVLPQNISFVGAGAGVTTIVTTGGVKPGTGDKIADMTIDARTGSNASFSFAIGADTTDTAFTDVTIAGVELLGNTDGFYFNKAGIDRVAVYDSYVSTTFETVFVGNTTGLMEFYDTEFVADGSIGGASICAGINATSGTTRVFGAKMTVSNSGSDARAIRASASGTTVESHNVRTSVFGSTVFDLHQSSSASIFNDGTVRSDGAALVTSGTINQVVNTYEGNIGLSDITTNNVSTTKHGFAPKAPNDATKYLDGTGAYTVPAGSGGNPVIQNVGDANATITSGTDVVNLTTTLTAARTLTLPAASGYATSPALVIIDPKAVTNGANTISVARAGSDTINGGTSNVVVLGANEAGGSATLYSDGTSKWTTVSRGGASRVTGYVDGTGPTSGKILKGDGTKFSASTETYAAPGTSGNVMTSDGTNWTSAAATGGGITDDPNILGMQALGSNIKAFPLMGNMGNISGSFFSLSDNQIQYIAVYLPKSATITGVRWYQSTNGNYTADNNNKVGLYSYSGGTMTKVAESTSDGNLWQQGGAAFRNKDFSSTYSASAGLYYVAVLWNNSAVTTTPTVAQLAYVSSNFVTFNFTNSARLFGTVTAQNDLPATQATSGFSGTPTTCPWVSLY